MAFRVTFTQKNGTPGKATFPSEALANSYARTVKAAKVEPVEAEVAPVVVKACPVGTVDAQKAASRDFYLTTKRGDLYVPAPVRAAQVSESEGETMMEHFNECRVMGVSSEDAWTDWDGR
jgi:hypothetical protein